ncbi:MAG TPA: methionyl-tRNA formyltransferase [bacterium]|nr:methionyl-tRNA formyltransferase [bacterium]
MRLAFLGTADFAVPGLDRLSASTHTVAGVVTVPDKPAGRGRKPRPSPVKVRALELGLPVLHPERLRDPAFLRTLESWRADCFIVVAFRILPPEVFRLPSKGTVNLHASLLPRYRGAAPIRWALMNGETETGVTTFLIDAHVDTGDLLLQSRVPILPDDDAGTLHDKLAACGAELLLETVDGLESGVLRPVPQRGEPTPAPKILPEHGRIDWSRPAGEILCQIRAFSPGPGAFTEWQGHRMKLFGASVQIQDTAVHREPGTILKTGQDGILVQAGSEWLRVRSVQIEGRKRMDAGAFLRGADLKAGQRFG